MRKITELNYNWRQCGEAGDQRGEDYDYVKVGVNGVKSIEIDVPGETYRGPDSYFVEYDDGEATRIYNPNQVFYAAKEGCNE